MGALKIRIPFNPKSEVAGVAAADIAASECVRPRAQQYSSARWWENSPRLGKHELSRKNETRLLRRIQRALQ